MREPNRTSRPHVLVRPADRAAGDRGDARRGARTRLVRSSDNDAVVLPSRARDPGATRVRAAMVSVCRTGGVLPFGRGNLVRRPAADPVPRVPLPDAAGGRIPARDLRDVRRAGLGLAIVLGAVATVVYKIPGHSVAHLHCAESSYPAGDRF